MPSAIPNILFITSHAPIPPINGGFQRSNLLGRALKRVGQLHTLYFRPANLITLTDEQRARLREEFGLVGVIPALDRHSMMARLAAGVRPGAATFDEWPEVSRAVREIVSIHPYDVIVCRYLIAAARSGVLFYRSGIPVIVDIDDLFGMYHRLRFEEPDVAAWRRLCRWYRWQSVQRRESHALSRLGTAWVSCAQDVDAVSHARVRILPNVPFEPGGTSAAADDCTQDPAARDVLFVGSLGMDWNIKAVTWFIDEIWPAVRRAAPCARFRIVGHGMTDAQRDAWSKIDGVDPVGFVEDLRAEYRRCALSVAPMRGGAGTKIKVLEAFKFGRTLVSTSHALRGFDHVVRNEEALLVGDEPETFAGAVVRLLRDPNRRQALADHGQHVVRRHFTFDHFAAIVAETVAGALEPSNPHRDDDLILP
jgi:glycosyltransferase involved in cell wall biosynthesis